MAIAWRHGGRGRYSAEAVKSLLLLACLLSCAWPLAARAAGPAGIQGRVTDQARTPVAQARVIITSEANQTSYRATTDSRGDYQVLGLPAGLYTVEVVVPAFKVALFRHVRVRAGRITRRNVVLRAGSAPGRT